MLVLAVLVGLGLRLARWINCLPTRAMEAVHSGATPRARGPLGLFGAGL
jgi:hypothetical protein